MKDFRKNVVEFWQDSANVLLGVWLVISAWVLQFTGVEAALWNAILFGLVIAASALSALVRFREWEEWVDIAIGAWLVISPWVLGFAAHASASEAGAAAATWNFVLVGIATLGMALWSIRDHRHAATHAH